MTNNLYFYIKKSYDTYEYKKMVTEKSPSFPS